ncbi:MAG: hypothetical protein P8I38_03955 [Arenicella sp.]|nr:hypothetical protein [Arenicella sp.]
MTNSRSQNKKESRLKVISYEDTLAHSASAFEEYISLKGEVISLLKHPKLKAVGGLVDRYLYSGIGFIQLEFSFDELDENVPRSNVDFDNRLREAESELEKIIDTELTNIKGSYDFNNCEFPTWVSWELLYWINETEGNVQNKFIELTRKYSLELAIQIDDSLLFLLRTEPLEWVAALVVATHFGKLQWSQLWNEDVAMHRRMALGDKVSKNLSKARSVSIEARSKAAQTAKNTRIDFAIRTMKVNPALSASDLAKRFSKENPSSGFKLSTLKQYFQADKTEALKLLIATKK